MASPTHSSSMESTTVEGNIRKRVCKACDRCRLKKSKCDGASPCSRCKADNAICVFGERKKTHDKVYPKGYVEMLEQQQTQLVAGLRELYRRLQTGEGWPGAPLHEGPAGHPLTHDVLERLDLLHIPSENGSPIQSEANFEEDFARIQHRLLEKGAGYHVRRGSVSSDSDHGHNSPSSNVVSPKHQLKFNDPFSIHRAPPTPPNNSPPFPQLSQLSSAKAHSIQQPQQRQQPQPQQQQQLHQNAYTTNTSTVRTGLDPSYLMRPSWSTEGTPAMMTDPASMDYITQFDSAMTYDEPMNNFDQFMMPAASALIMPDWNDPGEIDFNTYIDPIST